MKINYTIDELREKLSQGYEVITEDGRFLAKQAWLDETEKSYFEMLDEDEREEVSLKEWRADDSELDFLICYLEDLETDKRIEARLNRD